MSIYNLPSSSSSPSASTSSTSSSAIPTEFPSSSSFSVFIHFQFRRYILLCCSQHLSQISCSMSIFARFKERDCGSFISCSSSSSNSMHIILNIHWKIKINDKRNIINMNPSRCHICRKHYFHFAALKISQCLITLILFLIAMHACCVITLLPHHISNHICHLLCGNKAQNLCILIFCHLFIDYR